MFLSELYNKNKLNENISPIDLAEMLFNTLNKTYPEVVSKYGHEAVSNAVLDYAEDATDLQSVSDIDIAVQEIIDDLANYQGDRTNDLEPTRTNQISENLRKWFKEKWVRFGPDGKIRGACARGDDSEGKPKCLPQAKAHALGKKGRKYAAAKKRREDPNPERRGPAKNVATKKKSNEGVTEGELNEIAPLVAAAGRALAPLATKFLPKAASTTARTEPTLGASMVRSARTGEPLTLPSASAQIKPPASVPRNVSNVPATAAVAVPSAIAAGMTAANKNTSQPTSASQGQLPMTQPATAYSTAVPASSPAVKAEPQTFQQAFAAARKAAAASGDPSTGRFTWQGQEYQTNLAGDSARKPEQYTTRSKQRDVSDFSKTQSVNENVPKKSDVSEAMSQLDEKCWPGYEKKGMKTMFGKRYPNCVKKEDIEKQQCPECGGPMFSELLVKENKDACYYKVKSRYKVWPSAYASGALVQCRKRGAANWGKKKTNETRFYFTPKATDSSVLINEFKLQKDSDGWYIAESQGPAAVLEAQRAFGIPKIKEVKLKEFDLAAFSGSAAIKGDDNVLSPIGSIPNRGRRHA